MLAQLVASPPPAERPSKNEESPNTAPIIELSNVSKRFGSLRALGPIDLAIAGASFVSIVGPSGCGKSTLLRLMSGLDAPSEGRLQRYGADLDGPSRQVGIMFQDHVLLPWASVLENVMLPADVFALPRAAALERARWLLELTGLKDFADHKPHMLSGGMKQRAAFCRALLSDPELLLLDEPFGALDALSREELSLELSRLWQELARTAILITHDLEEAILLGDRLIIMSDRPGRILLDTRIDLPRPRDVDTAKHQRFQEIKQMARDLIFKRKQT